MYPAFANGSRSVGDHSNVNDEGKVNDHGDDEGPDDEEDFAAITKHRVA